MGLKPPRLHHFRRAALATLRRVVISSIASGALISAASLGMLVTTGNRWLSLACEPLSLLFLPGIVLAIAYTALASHLDGSDRTLGDKHDFAASFVVWCTFLFYTAVLYWLQRKRRRAAALTTSTTSR